MAHPYSDTRSEHHDRARGMVERTGNNCPKMARGGHADAAAECERLAKKTGRTSWLLKAVGECRTVVPQVAWEVAK